MKRLQRRAESTTFTGPSSADLVLNGTDIYGDSFKLAQQLIRSLPVLETNLITIELARAIQNGDFGNSEQMLSNWNDSVKLARDWFRSQGIVLS